MRSASYNLPLLTCVLLDLLHNLVPVEAKIFIYLAVSLITVLGLDQVGQAALAARLAGHAVFKSYQTILQL